MKMPFEILIPQKFQRREFDTRRPVRPQLGKGIDEITIGIFFKTLQRHGASRRVPNQAFQLVTPMRWDLGVGVQRKPVDAGTAGACECGVFTFITAVEQLQQNPTYRQPAAPKPWYRTDKTLLTGVILVLASGLGVWIYRLMQQLPAR